jgi:hypothetical protein
MNLTTEEIVAIADRLDKVIGIYFQFNACVHRSREGNDYEISDEDVQKIKDELKRTL